MQENQRILLLFWSFHLVFVMLQYAMDVKWKMIGNEQMQSKISQRTFFILKSI